MISNPIKSSISNAIQSAFGEVTEGLIILNGISYDNTDQPFELDVEITPMNLTLNPSIAGDDKVLDTFYVPTGLSVESDNSLSTFGQITGTLDSGLTDDYYEMAVRVTARGAYTGQQDVTVIFNLDTVAPVLSSPTDTKTSDTQATASVSTDKAGGTAYAVVTTSTTAPTATQIIAGQDHTGASAAATDSGTVSGTGVQNFSFTGLTPSTQYYTHFVHPDGATITNTSDVSSADGFMTDAPPTYLTLENEFYLDLGSLGSTQNAGSEYFNNLDYTQSGASTTVANAVDVDNAATGISIENISAWAGAAGNGIETALTGTKAAKLVFPSVGIDLPGGTNQCCDTFFEGAFNTTYTFEIDVSGYTNYASRRFRILGGAFWQFQSEAQGAVEVSTDNFATFPMSYTDATDFIDEEYCDIFNSAYSEFGGADVSDAEQTFDVEGVPNGSGIITLYLRPTNGASGKASITWMKGQIFIV